MRRSAKVHNSKRTPRHQRYVEREDVGVSKLAEQARIERETNHPRYRALIDLAIEKAAQA